MANSPRHRFWHSGILVHGSYVFACLSAFIFATSSTAAEYESRIWSDKSGKHEIKAKFIDLVDGQVRLERPNGDVSRIPLEKLSVADQDYVKNGAKSAQPHEPAAPAPQGLQVGDRVEAQHFGKWKLGVVTEIDYKWDDVEVRIDGDDDMDWTKDLDELRYPGTTQQPFLVKPASPASSLKTVRPDYDDMARLIADGTPADKIQADPHSDAGSAWKPRAVRLSGKSDFFEKPADFVVTASAEPLALILHGNHHGEALPRVEIVDLSSRKVVASGPAPPGTSKLVLSPSGTTIATAQSDLHGDDSSGQVDIWKLADKKISHLVSFVPYVMNTWPNLDPEWFAWLDDKRLFTVNSEGQLLLWNASDAKANYELMLDRGVKPLLTAGRRHLVVPTSAGVQFYDADSGDLLAVVGSGNFRNATLAFSPSGRQLAIASNEFIDVFDITTGETTRSFPCRGLGFRDELTWVDEDYLFSAGGLLINVPLRIIAWKFDIRNQLVKSFAGTHWMLLDNHAKKTQALVPFELPPPEALEAVKDLSDEDLLVVKPGDSISIDVQIPEDNLLAQDVQQSLEEALADANMKLVDDSPLKLVARTKTGETQKIRYRGFHDHFGKGELIDVVNRIYEMELLLNGAVIWKRESVHSAPYHLQLQEGESTRTAIDRVMKPSGANFKGRLPSFVVRPEYMEPLGKSNLSLGF
ncbi:SHD1 domain-containing protein [Bythopirellula goksoeyrii]|uniref:SLA1 homology domain-containing protein n=1 Tax=Bythopirellula goksoeyrii TaxID=1400387 RepID=A0A5B9QJP7_9BACT|nr:SHD1 domain-containing protein [Bythopirellula goksoeyrii]QEG34381.1 hypothetical protein Pr1d_16570 [Bythopirellula goksoeyrii]